MGRLRSGVLLCVVASALSGCAGSSGASSQSVVTPTPSRVARSRPTPRAHTPPRPASAALSHYSCAVIPVADGLQTAAARYGEAQSAAAAQLPQSAQLDMRDAISLSRTAAGQLASLRPPSAMARYQALLVNADSAFQASAPALRGDFAASNLSAAQRDGRRFEQGKRALAAARRERARLGRQVALPDVSSPACTQSYLRQFLARTPQPRPTAPLPSSTPSPPAAPTSKPTRVPHTSTRHTPQPSVRIPPTAVPTPTTGRPELALPERKYIAAETKVLTRAATPRLALESAHDLLVTRQTSSVPALIDSATKRLKRLQASSAEIHPPSPLYALLHREAHSAIASAITAARKLRLSMIDLALGSSTDGERDLTAAQTYLDKSSRQSRDVLRALRRARSS